MKLATRGVAGLFSLLFAVVATGYLSARLRLEECRAETAKHVMAKPVFGQDFGGEPVRVQPTDVSARVAGLFQVETQYMVPTGLHGTLHIQRFTVMPWGIAKSSSEVVHLV